MAGSPYFCDDYFDPIYFDTGSCAPPTGGHRAVWTVRRSPESIEDEETFLLLVT